MNASRENQEKLDTLGGRIRAMRQAHNLTVTDTAARVGISRVQLTQWEAGRVLEPGAYQLLRFTKLVDVNLNWLLERAGPDPEILRRPKRQK